MKTLFDQIKLSGMKMKNRFVRSATYDGRSDSLGHVTENLIHLYENLAKGGVGTIITGLTNVTDIEKIVPGQMAIYNDSFIEEYRKFTDTVHKYDANIIVQLVCNGVQNRSKNDGVLWGPSAVEDLAMKTVPKEMTKEDIQAMKDAFSNGALRAKKAGFDGVQLHVAHGYLLSRFLTPYYNRRTDGYGGSIENRVRVILEIAHRIRELVGQDYPVLAKINCDDFMDQGLTFEECKYVCKMLEKAGLSAVEISGGTMSSRANEGTIRKVSSETESYFAQYAAEIAEEINIPVISVGGHRDINKLTDIVNQTNIEYISLCRPFIREPELINRWAGGDRTPAKCISCSKCFGVEVKCIFNK
ncbi:NADH:flavin oxidoreductase [Clostridium sp. Marseille-P2415]|uniref:NADH:flavin oxidoreductase n=1 Tax=Clostridium sp. Marseille-P2415 TaxID=1805471 RepID=UPI00098830D9|nr:NADH:flavin oxidoreductase [Clostridium sp. Marseille-P2415]